MMLQQLRILAQVNVLCKQTIEWVPIIQHLTPIMLSYKQDLTTGDAVIYLDVDGKDETSLDLQISYSDSKLKKVSECFVRWKDLQNGKVWGLNFLSEEEALEFMAFCEGCSPDTSESCSTSSKSLKTEISASSLNSIVSQKDTSKDSDQIDENNACIVDNNNYMHDITSIMSDGGYEEHGTGSESSGEKQDLCLTEYGYFKEMEIFHTTPNGTMNVDQFDGDSGIIITDSSSGTSMVLRRSGWLTMKQLLSTSRGGRVEQLSHKRWKNYWVILKGYELRLYQCSEKELGSLELHLPDIVIELEGCLAQALPEYVKLEHVFGISTKYGDAYYFQGSNQTEIEGWIGSIHSASAAQFAGGRGKEQTKWLLNKEVEKARESFESDEKLRKMAELQLNVVSDAKSKQGIIDQILRWEQNLEKLSLDIYKFQCYLSAVSSLHPPNQQNVIACATKQTKQHMTRIGLMSVVTFHSLVYGPISAKNDGHLKIGSKVKRSKSSVGYSRLKSALMSSLKISDPTSVSDILEHHSPKTTRRSGSVDGTTGDVTDAEDLTDWSRVGNFVRVRLPDDSTTVVVLRRDMTFADMVNAVSRKRQLEQGLYFIKFGTRKGTLVEYHSPQEDAFVDDQNFCVLKLCKKSEYDIEMTKTNDDNAHFGLSFKIENNRIIVSKVEDGSISQASGFYEGDEILSVNSKEILSPEQGLSEIIYAAKEPFISLRIRSLREEVPEQTRKTTENIINTLVCPPPPPSSSSEVVDLTELIVPPPQFIGEVDESNGSPKLPTIEQATEDKASVNDLLQSAEEVTTFCRQYEALIRDAEKQTEQLSDAEKLQKIILELHDTEKSYLKDVQTLLKRYLEPLAQESFLPTEEVTSFTENVSQILQFQGDFCREIQQLIDSENDFKDLKEVQQFQDIIYGIGEAFLQYADKFKVYSSFCATHSRIIHMLHPGSNEALEEFLSARNPKQQHSTKLESYLIKPIQRILKYPLLLNGMLKLLKADSDEYKCLDDAMNKIEKVAEHINEMQSITEQFLQVFQELAKSAPNIEVTDVDIDKLLLHKKQITWLNNPDTLKTSSLRWSPAPLRKAKSTSTMRCFVFPKAVILVQVERRQKKKDKVSKSLPKQVSEEINFKTLIPMTSLILRDNSWSDQGLFNAWELVDILKNNDDNKMETVYLLSSRNCDERNETVKIIKETIRKSMSGIHANGDTRIRPKSLYATNSTQYNNLAVDSSHVRRSHSHEMALSRPKIARSLGRHYSADDAYSSTTEV